MRYEMSLRPEPFGMIKCGKKTYELRLYDEKRQLLQIGDEIRFTNTEDAKEQITVRILELCRFDSFAQLYAGLPLLQCGYTEETVSQAKPSDMEQYYSKEEQTKYGVVGIRIERIA